MSITLHTHPFSSNGQKAQLMLDVVGLDYTVLKFPYEAAQYGIVLGTGAFSKEAAPEDEVRAKFDAAVPKLNQAMRVLDPVGPWARLGRRTIADIAATPVLHRLVHAPVDLSQVPRMQAWADACIAMPEWQALVPTCGVPAR